MSLDNLGSLAETIRQERLSILAEAASDPVLEAAGWIADLSRQYVSDEISNALLAHADSVDLKGAVERLFGGAIVNPSEDRPCLLYTSPSPRDQRGSRMPSSA